MQAVRNLPQTAFNGQPNTQHSNTDNRIVNRIFWAVALAVCGIGLGSFSLSFMALYALATANGTPTFLGWIWPLIVDVSMVIYTAAILVAHLQYRGAKLPISLTIFYALVTITGNILHAPPTPLGWFVASLPPLSLIFGTEMLRAMAHHIILHKGTVLTLEELTAQLNTRRADLDSIKTQIEQTQTHLEQIQPRRGASLQTQKMSSTVEHNTLEQARQAKAEQDSLDKESRLTALVDILNVNPQEGVKRLAEQLDVSRTTVYNDLSTLESQGVISKNGKGWKVTRL